MMSFNFLCDSKGSLIFCINISENILNGFNSAIVHNIEYIINIL